MSPHATPHPDFHIFVVENVRFGFREQWSLTNRFMVPRLAADDEAIMILPEWKLLYRIRVRMSR